MAPIRVVQQHKIIDLFSLVLLLWVIMRWWLSRALLDMRGLSICQADRRLVCIHTAVVAAGNNQMKYPVSISPVALKTPRSEYKSSSSSSNSVHLLFCLFLFSNYYRRLVFLLLLSCWWHAMATAAAVASYCSTIGTNCAYTHSMANE